MTALEPKAAIEGRAAPKAKRDIKDYLYGMQEELERTLRTPEAAQILLRHVLTCYRLNPKLQQCTAGSIAAAVLLSAQMRLEPGPLDHVYLYPRGQECVWALGYRGKIELASRSGRVGDLEANVIWDCDDYEPPRRENGRLYYRHAPGPIERRKERIGVLVTWQEKSGGKWFPRAHFTTPQRVERAKKASAAASKGSGPWHGESSDVDKMWCKTGIHDADSKIPMTEEAAYAVTLDNATMQDLRPNNDGEVEPVYELDAGEVGDGDN